MIELHGSALRFFCPRCHKSVDADIVFTIFQKDIEIPLCENCGKPLKPDVVLFEEPLPMDSWKKAEEEASRADLMIVIGSSLEVYPACTIPQSAVQRGCRLIINNLSSTPLDSLATVQLKMDTAELLPALLKAVEQIDLH